MGTIVSYTLLGFGGSPVSLQTAKLHLRVGGCVDAASADSYAAEDATVALYLAGATSVVETYLGRGLLAPQWRMTASALDDAGGLEIVGGPLQDAAPTVEALVGGTYQTLDPALVTWRRLGLERMTIRPAAGAIWPTADRDVAAWRVTFTAGYGAAGDVPPAIISAILLAVDDLYRGGGGMTDGVRRVLFPLSSTSI